MRVVLSVCAVALVLAIPTGAQESACSVPDEAAISSVLGACDELGPNEVCYGQSDVEVIVNCTEAQEFDQMSLEGVCSLRTEGEGIAVLRLQPDNDSLTLFAFGDVEMQNVRSNDAGIMGILTTDTDIYEGPGSHFSVKGGLAEGSEVFVNACSCTGNWLRIVQEGGEIGWIPNRRVDIGDTILPEADVDDTLYDLMQSFLLNTGECGGVLIQMDDSPVPIIINGVTITLDSTAYIRADSNRMEIDLLAGQGRVSNGEHTVYAPAGAHVLISLDDHRNPFGDMHVELYELDHVQTLPLGLLSEPINPLRPLVDTKPIIVGVEECNVVSNLAEEPCPVQFINPDGDDIISLDAEFVYASVGDWEQGTHDSPSLLSGTTRAGVLGWDVSCTLGSENFIGPIEWLLTIEDSAGNRSEPFLAAFNCVDGK